MGNTEEVHDSWRGWGKYDDCNKDDDVNDNDDDDDDNDDDANCDDDDCGHVGNTEKVLDTRWGQGDNDDNDDDDDDNDDNDDLFPIIISF